MPFEVPDHWSKQNFQPPPQPPQSPQSGWADQGASGFEERYQQKPDEAALLGMIVDLPWREVLAIRTRETATRNAITGQRMPTPLDDTYKRLRRGGEKVASYIGLVGGMAVGAAVGIWDSVTHHHNLTNIEIYNAAGTNVLFFGGVAFLGARSILVSRRAIRRRAARELAKRRRNN